MKNLGLALIFAYVVVPASTHAQNAYITNLASNTVSVIATATNTAIGSPIPVGLSPLGVAVTPDRSKGYVTNHGANTVSAIHTATNSVSATIPVGASPFGVAVTPDGTKVYVARSRGRGGHFGGGRRPDSVSVIETVTNAVIATVPVGFSPFGVAVTPDGSKVYVANSSSNTVSVIDTVTNAVIATVPVGLGAAGVAVTPDGNKVYVANEGSNTVSVIDTATNTVIGSPIPVGDQPVAFGLFIQPALKFAGVPGAKNCHGTSVSALATKFGGLNAAAATLGFSDVQGLQDAIRAFCEG